MLKTTTVKELRESLEPFPDDAIVVIEIDKGEPFHLINEPKLVDGYGTITGTGVSAEIDYLFCEVKEKNDYHKVDKLVVI